MEHQTQADTTETGLVDSHGEESIEEDGHPPDRPRRVRGQPVRFGYQAPGVPDLESTLLNANYATPSFHQPVQREYQPPHQPDASAATPGITAAVDSVYQMDETRGHRQQNQPGVSPAFQMRMTHPLTKKINIGPI